MDLDKYQRSYAELSQMQRTKNLDYYAYPARYYVKPFHIAGGLYYVGDEKVCAHLLDTGDGLILFDSGFQHTIHLMIQAIWELGFNPADIKYLIHSHEHFDHIGAANEFQALYGCKLVLSRRGAHVFRERPELVFLEASPNPYATLFTPDIELEDEDILRLGRVSIRCVETPGHSDGVMSFFFDVEENGHSYHVGYFGGMGFNTLYREALLHDGRPLETQQQFLASLQKVREVPVDITMGNHPRQNETLKKREQMLAGCGHNPFIDPAEWKTTIDTLTREFNSLLQREAEQLGA